MTASGNGARPRVVVTGMGTVNPLGRTLEDYWHGLIEGRSTARNASGSLGVKGS